MKLEFRAHPLMAFSMIKPFLFILVLPFIKGAIQYILYGEMNNVLNLEAVAITAILIAAIFKWRAMRISAENGIITVKKGFFIKSTAVIKASQLSSVSLARSPIDVILSSVTFRINTEAGRVGKPDFEIKLWLKDAKLLSKSVYGGENRFRISYSPVRIAAMAATTSSAFTGLIIGVPIVKKAGDLLGVALSDMLFDEINNVSSKFNTLFPPAVNITVLVFVFAYGFSFLVSFFKFINFRLFISDKKLETKTGFIVRKKTVFSKRSINDVCIEQLPLMRLFRLYSVFVTVGGYGDNRGEKAVIVPCGRHSEIKRQFEGYFPFLSGDGNTVYSRRGAKSLWRSLFVPRIVFCIIVLLSSSLMMLFSYFDSLILFLTLVSLAVTLYYSNLCFYNYRCCKLKLGSNIFAQGSKGFGTRELYCEKEKLGMIKIIRTPADRRYNTCKVKLTVRSESADSVRVRNLDYSETLSSISDCFDLSGIYSEKAGNID